MESYIKVIDINSDQNTHDENIVSAKAQLMANGWTVTAIIDPAESSTYDTSQSTGVSAYNENVALIFATK